MDFDGLNKKFKKENKVYRAASRINFLIERPETKEPPANSAKDQIFSEKTEKEADYRRLERPRLKKSAVIKISLTLILIILISGAMYLSEIVFSSGHNPLAGLNKFNPLVQLAKLIISPERIIDGEIADRINILLSGMGGPGHDGPYLTDTMIIASIKPSTGEVGLISLPRDLVVEVNKGQWVKINEVYAIGRSLDEKTAADYTKKVIEKTLDLPIHYYGFISFKGFEEFIDNIGGITVKVERGFVDSQYPTNDFKTTTVSFQPGLQTMNGQTALIFARSRHGTNFEGSDFARSRRQQLILQAVKEKIFKFSTLLSPQKMEGLYKLVADYLETNMSIWQAIKIANFIKETTESKIYRFVLDDGPDSLLEPGFTKEGAWILQPKDGNFQAIQRMANNIFNFGFIKQETAKIEIQNGTGQAGLAYWTTVRLERLGYQVTKYSNASTSDYQKSVIYDLSDGNKKRTLKWLKEELSAYVAKTLPDYLSTKSSIANDNSNSATKADQETDPDFIVVLGTNYAETFKLPQEKPVKTTSSATGWATSTINVATSTPAIENNVPEVIGE